MKQIVFVEMSKTSSGVEYLEAAKRLGLFLTFVTFNPDYYSKPKDNPLHHPQRYADRMLIVDTHHDIQGLVGYLSDYHRSSPIDGVFASMDLELYQAAVVAKQLGLPGLDPEAVKICRDKYLTRRVLQEHGIPCPRFAIVGTLEEAQGAAEAIGYPCVLKPLDCAGSEGVRLIRAPQEFVEPILEHKANPIYWRGVPKNSSLLVEEFMEGPLVSVETITYQGVTHVLGITDRILGRPPYFAELAGLFPARIPDEAQVIGAALDALRAVKYDFGPAHTELILTSGGPRIVEINPRIGGVTISQMISHCRGYSVHEQVLRMHLGLPCEIGGSNSGACVMHMIISPRAGRLDRLDGAKEAMAVPGVLSVLLEKRLGDEITDLPIQNMDVLGVVTAAGATRAEAVANAHTALRRLQIRIAGKRVEPLLFELQAFPSQE